MEIERTKSKRNWNLPEGKAPPLTGEVVVIGLHSQQTLELIKAPDLPQIMRTGLLEKVQNAALKAQGLKKPLLVAGVERVLQAIGVEGDGIFFLATSPHAVLKTSKVLKGVCRLFCGKDAPVRIGIPETGDCKQFKIGYPSDSWNETLRLDSDQQTLLLDFIQHLAEAGSTPQACYLLEALVDHLKRCKAPLSPGLKQACQLFVARYTALSMGPVLVLTPELTEGWENDQLAKLLLETAAEGDISVEQQESCLLRYVDLMDAVIPPPNNAEAKLILFPCIKLMRQGRITEDVFFHLTGSFTRQEGLSIQVKLDVLSARAQALQRNGDPVIAAKICADLTQEMSVLRKEEDNANDAEFMRWFTETTAIITGIQDRLSKPPESLI